MVPLVLLKLKVNPAPIKILISHNTFLYHFLTFGIVGLLCYCIFLWRIFVLIWRQLFSERESGVFLALLVSFLAFSCFEADFLGKNFCMIFAVLLAQVFQKDGNDAFLKKIGGIAKGRPNEKDCYRVLNEIRKLIEKDGHPR